MKRFNWRAFTSLYILFSFIMMVISGIILFIAPPGRIAHWTYISLLGLEKDQWQTIHTLFTFLFILATAFHLYFNWSIFISYLKNKLSKKFALKTEVFFALLLTIILLVIGIYNAPPVSQLMAVGQHFTDSWALQENEPPIPHTEGMTLQEISEKFDLKMAVIHERLQSAKINFEHHDQKLEEIAASNSRTPQEIFALLTKKRNSQKLHNGQNQSVAGTKSVAGRGWGRKSVAELCTEYNVGEKAALNRLKKQGIIAESSSRLKDLARHYNLSAAEIVEIMSGKKVSQ